MLISVDHIPSLVSEIPGLLFNASEILLTGLLNISSDEITSIGDEYKNITTDEKGFFKIESVASGSYEINISMAGYKSEIIKLIIAQDQNKVLTVKLIPSEITTGEIKVTSVIRVGRLAVVSGEILLGAIGEISSERLNRVKKNLSNWLSEK